MLHTHRIVRLLKPGFQLVIKIVDGSDRHEVSAPRRTIVLLSSHPWAFQPSMERETRNEMIPARGEPGEADASSLLVQDVIPTLRSSDLGGASAAVGASDRSPADLTRDDDWPQGVVCRPGGTDGYTCVAARAVLACRSRREPPLREQHPTG
jgi:hypothetical protein